MCIVAYANYRPTVHVAYMKYIIHLAHMKYIPTVAYTN